MTQRTRVAVLLAAILVLVSGITAYAVGAAISHGRSDIGSPSRAVAPEPSPPTTPASGPRIVFRHTGVDDDYGRVASVPLDDPGAPRAFSDVSCDRVYATARVTSCLRIEGGARTTYSMTEYRADGQEIQKVSIPGIPSRTRLSADGSLVSSTTFVGGHSYMQEGFSTETEIRDVGGRSYGNLEKFSLTINGRRVEPEDRNVWGVTFADDDNTFYASVGTGGDSYLVRGDLKARTLTSIADRVECPSLSPNGKRIAFKQPSERNGETWWTPAVLDLATGHRTVLTAETHDVDDQLEWLDNHTVLYGLPREDNEGVTDVWSLDTRGDAQPHLFIQQAWSPAVVRP